MIEEKKPIKQIAIFGHQKLPDVEKEAVAISCIPERERY